jgi:hypothetical protein
MNSSHRLKTGLEKFHTGIYKENRHGKIKQDNKNSRKCAKHNSKDHN